MNQAEKLDVASGTTSRRFPAMPDIPRRRYTDEALFQLELSQVFRRSWLYAGHASQYEMAGAYRLLELPFAPVFVVRGEDGVFRAFLNSCRHRGATVLKDSCGRVRNLSCQYHGWTYDLKGRLIGVPDRDAFPDLIEDQRSLVELRCEQWGGFLFVNFDPDAEPLLSWLEPLVRRYTPMMEAPLRVLSHDTWQADCNWKLVVDAFRESYHIDMVHRQSLSQLVTADQASFDMYAHGHFTLYTPLAKQIGWSSATQARALAMLPGADASVFSENIVLPGIFPSTLISLQSSGFPVLTMWPLAVDRTRIDFTWFGMDWGDGPRPPEWDVVTAAFNLPVEEDIRNLASIQSALGSAPDKGIPLSVREALIYQFHAEIDRLVEAGRVPAGLHVPDVLADQRID